jgi:outer membrane protein assembly factor BamB
MPSRRWVGSLLLLVGCRSGTGLVQTEGIGSAQSVDFGRVVVGETLLAQMPIQNTGISYFDFTGSPTLSGINPGDFQATEPSQQKVQSGATVNAPVLFSPTAAGARSASVFFPSDSKSTPSVTAQLTGVGVDPGSLDVTVAPPALDFGSVHVPQSKTLQLVISNGSADIAPLEPLVLSGPQASSFSLAAIGLDGGSLPPLPGMQSVDVQVTFTPQTMGSVSGTLTVTACRLCAPIAVPLKGTALNGELVYNPTSLAFGAVRRGRPAFLPITLTNQGNGDVTVNGVDLQSGVSPFSPITDGGGAPLPVDLQPGQSYTLVVAYEPPYFEQVGEMDTDNLVAAVNYQGQPLPPVLAPVIGQVAADCTLVISPSSVLFGYSTPANPTFTQWVTLTNHGMDPCTASGFMIDPTSDQGFNLSQPAPSMLAVPSAGSAQVGLQFAPTKPDHPWERDGHLLFQSTDPTNPNVSIPLTGFAQTSPYAHSAWPRSGHDPGNTYLSDSDTPTSTGTLQWQAFIATPSVNFEGMDQPAYYWQSPSIGTDGTIYVLGWDGMLHAIEPTMGNELWASSAAVPSPFGNGFDGPPCTPTVQADGTVTVLGNVYLGTAGQNQLFRFSPSGDQIASTPTSSTVVTSAASLGPDNTVYFSLALRTAGNAQGVTAYSPEAGVFEWTTCLGCPADTGGSPTAGVYQDDGTSYWIGLDVRQIQQLFVDGGGGWAITPALCGAPTLEDIGGLIFFDGGIYFFGDYSPDTGSDGTALGVLNPNDGTILWSSCVPGVHLFGSPAAVTREGDLIVTYQGTTDAGLARIGATGLQWSNAMPYVAVNGSYGGNNTGGNPPAIGGDGTIFVTGSGPQLSAVDPANGHILWSIGTATSVPADSAPIIGSDGTIYFMDHAGYLNAIR